MPVGGPSPAADGLVVLSPYDPGWAVLFEEERGRLEAALATWLVGPVEHIGSTQCRAWQRSRSSTMLAPVRSLAATSAAIGPVTALGYRPDVHRPAEAPYFKP